jgi:hypothetical protein
VAADAGGSAAAQVSVRIDIKPAGATVLLDGARLPNPFHGRFARSELSHQLKATAPGHEDWAEWVTFSEDRTLTVELKAREVAAADAGPAAPAVATPVTPVTAVRPPGSRRPRPVLRIRPTAPVAPAAPAAPAPVRTIVITPKPPKPKAVPQVDETYPPP